jgi:hypothetical protein
MADGALRHKHAFGGRPLRASVYAFDLLSGSQIVTF